MRKRRVKKGLIASVLVVCLSFTTINPVMARFTSVDPQGDTYYGEEIVAANTDTTIATEETLLAGANTGVRNDETAQQAWSMEGAQVGETPAVCGTMMLPDLSLDRQQIEAEVAQAQGEPTFAYKEDDEKVLWTIKWSYDDETEEIKQEEIEQTVSCMAIGQHVTVWQQTDDEENGSFDAGIAKTQAKAVAEKFDGDIYDKMQAAFGETGKIDVDHDEKIAIIISDLGDAVPGYFREEDLLSVENGHGNQMDMIHMNSQLTDDLDSFYNTMVHEYQHAINYAVVEKRDAWVDEMFSQNAPEVCGIANGSENTYTDRLSEFIQQYQCTVPFIFQEDYVPQKAPYNRLVYAQWYLFGRYLTAQTAGVYGGGENIYKSILAQGSCTTDALIQVLRLMGVSGDGGEVQDFDSFVCNYNLALRLQEQSGRYSFKGCNITGFTFPKDGVGEALPAELYGGGAAAFAQNDLENGFTPGENAAPSMRFAGVDTGTLDAVVADKDGSHPVVIGEQLKLFAPDEGVSIYYTYSNDLTIEPPDPVKDGANVLKYTEPITVTGHLWIKAAAFDDKGRRSAVSQYQYYAEPAKVKSSAESGHIKEGTALTLSCETEGANILYTTDGSDPYIRVEGDQIISNGKKYDPNIPFIVNQNMTLRAIAYLPDSFVTTTEPSSISTWEYVVDPIILDRYEPNDTIGVSTAISFPTRFEGFISTEKDVDYYTFQTTGSVNLDIALTVQNKTSNTR